MRKENAMANPLLTADDRPTVLTGDQSDAKPRAGRIIREPELKKRDGKSRTQRWRDIRAGKFPAPVQLGPNSIGWYEDEIDAWLASRPRVIYAPPEKAVE